MTHGLGWLSFGASPVQWLRLSVQGMWFRFLIAEQILTCCKREKHKKQAASAAHPRPPPQIVGLEWLGLWGIQMNMEL